MSTKDAGAAAPPRHLSLAISAPTKTSHSKRLRVLVVDDDPLVLLAVERMLTRLGCEVHTASNGQAACEAVVLNNSPQTDRPLELIFMDANMPVMSGYESAARITQLAREGRIQGLAIVCLSAQDSGEHEELCKRSGMERIRIIWRRYNCEVVEKPCSIRTLKEVLKCYGYVTDAAGSGGEIR